MLKPLSKRIKKRKFFTYDMEWIPADPERAAKHGFDPLELRLIGVYDGDRFRHYKTIPAFLTGELTRENKGKWFYAHAGGAYDLRFTLEYLLENPQPGLQIDCAFKGSSAVIVKLSRGTDIWWLLDSYFLIRQSLRKIGEWMGLSKGGAAESIDIFYAPISELITYNERDCVLLWEAIAEFERTLNGLGGQLEKTVASSALGLFKRRYLDDIIPTSPACNEIARDGYVGSRVEVFAKECGKARYYDINSSFPHAMREPCPGRILSTGRGIPKKGLYMADVEIDVPEQKIPPLPYRTRKGRIFFPWGKWRCWLGNVDIEFLEECGGRIVTAHNHIRFLPFTGLKNYAEEIYELRKAAPTDAEKQVLKILLNSCYGKFAESAEKSQIIIHPDSSFFKKTTEDPEKATKERPLRREVIPGVFEFKTYKEPSHTHVPISSHITALARRNLTRYLREAKRCYYCDTDGFAVGYREEYETSNELGGLKLEKTIRRGRFAAPKLYALETSKGDWMVKAKGFSKVVSSDGGRGVKYKDFTDLLEHRELPLAHFIKPKEGLKKGEISPREEVRMKTWRGKLRPKRNFISDRHSKPWHVDEIRRD